MSDAATAQTHTARNEAPAIADLGEDWAGALLERQIWILGQLAEDGLEIARAIKRQAAGQASEAGSQEPVHEVVRGDIPAAHARVARAVRLTLMLQSKVIQELQRLDSLEASKASSAKINADAERPFRTKHRKALVGRVVARVAQAEHENPDAVERLVKEAAERMEASDIYGDVLSRPASEMIDRICKDMGLSPDWPRLAQEAWAQAEIGSGRVGAPLAALTAEDPDARRPTGAADANRLATRAASP